MTRVYFQGRAIGTLPARCFERGMRYYQIALMPEMVWARDPQPFEFPAIETARFRVEFPDELHAESLRGLLRIPDFAPEDSAIAAMKAADA